MCGIPAASEACADMEFTIGAKTSPRETVHAVDGEIWRVQGFLVDPGDSRATHLLGLAASRQGPHRCYCGGCQT